MKIFKRRKQLRIKQYLKLILEELQEIGCVIKEVQNRDQKVDWLMLSQEDDIKKLKEENRKLKKQMKGEKNGKRPTNSKK